MTVFYPKIRHFTKITLYFKTLEENLETGHQLKLFQLQKSRVSQKNLTESGWTLVLELKKSVFISNSTSKFIVKAVNGKFASINKLGTRISVTSHPGNRDLSSTPQLKIGTGTVFGVILSFENAFESVEMESASIYFSEFSNVDCLDDESLSL